MSTKVLNVAALLFIAVAAGFLTYHNWNKGQSHELLNASYDPTREVYVEINARFVDQFRKDTGQSIGIKQSHAGSSRQAKAVATGLAADVVTLALPSDIESLHQYGLVGADWQKQFPNNAQPYSSTIVFVVRKGNPKNIHDWTDLTAPGLALVTPDPKTSGNGKLSFLAAWGSVIYQGGTEDQARDLVRRIYQNVSVLGAGSRDSTNTFELAKEGDVHLTWENEAIREVAASKGDLEIVYPSVSIRAEPSIAIIDSNVAKHHLEAAATSYLNYLYSDDAQEIFAKDGYRPSNPAILSKHQDLLPNINLFPVTLIAKDWNDAQTKFFSENGIYDVIHLTKNN